MFRPDSAAMRGGPAREVRGSPAVARLYEGRAQGTGPALINGAVSIVVASLGQIMMLIRVTVGDGKITALDVTADPAKLREVEIAAIDERSLKDRPLSGGSATLARGYL